MARKLSQINFIEKCNIVHNEKYDYSKTIYTNYRTKIIIICTIHGNFEMLPDNHANQGQGCAKCAQDNHKLSKISDERLENLREIHNNKYVYENLQVVDGKIEIICPTHGKFEQSIYQHEDGHGCNQCVVDSRKVVKYKKCRCCKIKKELSEYSSKFKTCRNCVENKPIISSKVCIKCNMKKQINEFNIRKDSYDGYRNDCIECNVLSQVDTRKRYRQKNRVSLRKKDIVYRKTRMESDSLYRAKIDARNVIRKSLSKKGYSKKSKTQEILGCSYEEFRNHLELLFLPDMSWGNRGIWHIDHIIPISFAKNEEELIKLNNYKNLRPLWGSDNLSKGDDILVETEIYDEILLSRINYLV